MVNKEYAEKLVNIPEYAKVEFDKPHMHFVYNKLLWEHAGRGCQPGDFYDPAHGTAAYSEFQAVREQFIATVRDTVSGR